MKSLSLNITYKALALDELSAADRDLVMQAKQACRTSYAPYSRFCVGSAVRLEGGEVVCGSNQENAAFPSGTCAERCAMFYANAHRPELAPEAIAIAACNQQGQFTPMPITPCGACRQVLIETQKRYGRNLRIVLYGESVIYELGSVSDLLPFQFDADAL